MSRVRHGLRILINNGALMETGGTEIFTRDLALRLLARGHHPVVHCVRRGPVADAIERASVPVVDDLAAIGPSPDLIHGQSHAETAAALLRFPTVPALFVCHGWADVAPRSARILRTVAVDVTVRDSLLLRQGFGEVDVSVILNGVDLDRFLPRPPLPARPARAAVFSNYATHQTVATIRETCVARGIAVDVLGRGAGAVDVPDPENRLRDYDVVFAKGRCALEALAVGCAVIACDYGRLGGLVTTGNWRGLRDWNFGLRALSRPLHSAALAAELDRYDPADAAAVAAALRPVADLDKSIDLYESLYAEMLAVPAPADDPIRDRAEAAAFVEWLNRRQGARLVELDRWTIKLEGIVAAYLDRIRELESQGESAAAHIRFVESALAESRRLMAAAESELEGLRGPSGRPPSPSLVKLIGRRVRRFLPRRAA